MSLAALGDVLARQQKILANTKLLKTLPDGGAKIRAKKQQIEEAIKEKEQIVSKTADLLSSLTIGGEKVESVEEMEFRFGGGLARHLEERHKRVDLDSDDDDNDSEEIKNSLRVLAEKDLPSKYVAMPFKRFF